VAHFFFPRGSMDVEGLIRPVVEEDGLELVEIVQATEDGRKVLRVTVDHPGGTLNLDQIAKTSERISRRLDLEEYSWGRFALEVSSPGIERPLRTPAHFMRAVGQRVKVKVSAPAPETFSGQLAAADDDGFQVDVEDGERRIAFGDLVSARTVFEWGDKR